jgi:DNA-binding transcriptional LysR family regulator
MQVENFKVFVDLVETKSFSKSAKLNGITKAAVSQQTYAMERHFKAQLIDRSQTRFQLTSDGMRVYDGAKEVVHQYEKMLRNLQEEKKIISGTIRLSTIYSIGLHVLPQYIKKFLHDYPSVKVNVVYRHTNHVYKDILNNSVDFGLVAFPVEMRQIEIIPFRNDHFVLITHPSHPLARGGDVPLKALAKQKFIGLDVGGPAHEAIDQILRENKIEIDPMMVFDNIETVKKAVEIDAGIAIVPQLTVLQEVKQGLLAAMQFKGREFVRPLAILHRKGRVFMPEMKKFIETLDMDLSMEPKTHHGSSLEGTPRTAGELRS